MKPAPATGREIFAWSLYDFGNSAFATTILAVVFPLYFKNALSGEKRYGIVLAIAMAVAAAIAPILGAICDFSASKKRTLGIFCVIGCLGSMALYFPTTWLPAAAIFLVAMVGFEASTSIYNAFLPEIAGDRASRISSLGWACGYIGGGLHLFLALQIIQAGDIHFTKLALASVGAWWLLFSLPMLFMLKERAVPRVLPPGESMVSLGFRKVFSTIRSIRRFPTLARFTIAYLFFNDGVQTVIGMASTFGDEALRMDNTQLIKCFLLIQVVAAVGSLGFATVAGRLKDKPALVVSLVIWCGLIAWAFFMRTQTEFWMLGIGVGLVMGGTQAIARSLQAKFTPPSSAAEFFGFYAITGKAASAMGPLLFGLVWSLSGNIRWGILSVAILFIVGLVLLLPVNEEQGILEAKAEEKRLTGPDGTAPGQPGASAPR